MASCNSLVSTSGIVAVSSGWGFMAAQSLPGYLILRSLAVPLAVLELTGVRGAIGGGEGALAVGFAVLELTGVLEAIGVRLGTLAVGFAVLELAGVRGTGVHEGALALAVAQAVLELTGVRAAIVVLVGALAVGYAVLQRAGVRFALWVLHGALAGDAASHQHRRHNEQRSQHSCHC